MNDEVNNKTLIPPIDPVEYLGEEWAEWVAMTPQQRFAESAILWQHYVSLGGSLDPEPDTQSPFYDPEESRRIPPNGRSSMHIVRRGRI